MKVRTAAGTIVAAVGLVTLGASAPASAHWTATSFGPRTAAAHAVAKGPARYAVRAGTHADGAVVCVLGTDPAGNASVATGNADALDLTKLSMSADDKNLNVMFTVNNLNDAPGGQTPLLYGTVDLWSLLLTDGAGNTYSITASFGQGGEDGTIFGNAHEVVYTYWWTNATTAMEGAETGSFDGTSSTVTVTVPLKALGLKYGDVLTGLTASSSDANGAWLDPGDQATLPNSVNQIAVNKPNGDPANYKIGGCLVP